MIERLYKLLLLLSPREFRERFGEELLQTARAVERERTGLLDHLRAGADAVLTICALRADFRTEARQDHSKNRDTAMSSLFSDVRFAARGLRREPGFTLFVAATLALGIGANAAMFGIADRLLLRGPEHVRDSDRVARVFLTAKPDGMAEYTTDTFGHVQFTILRKLTSIFDGVAQYAIYDAVEGRGANARAAKVGFSSARLFPLLGVRPALGRFFNEVEDTPNAAERVVVLSNAIWRRAFGGRADVIGQSVVIDDRAFTVVGVAPHGFTGPKLTRVDYWAPASLVGQRITADWTETWDAQWLEGVVRLKPGVTREQVAREMTAAQRRDYNGTDKEIGQAKLFVAGLSSNSSGAESADVTVLRWLSGVAVMVLLIACANVANLLIARGVRRSREMAIRAALGAGRMRLMRLLLLESLMLSLGGAVFGMGIAYVLGNLARASAFTYIDWTTAPVSGRVIVVSGLVAVITGLFIGLIPAFRISRPALAGGLKSGAREGGGRRSRVRAGLTVVQAALSVALMIGAGLFVKSLWNVRGLDLGLDTERVLTVTVNRSGLAGLTDSTERSNERARRREFLSRSLEEIAALPGVQRASISVGMPFGNRYSVALRVPGFDSVPRLSTGRPSVSAVSSNYFAAVGTSIIRGRAFTQADREGSERVTIVNATMAQTLWPNTDPIGKCINAFSDTLPCARVVGVAENTRRARLREEPSMHYYVPLGQGLNISDATLLLRSAGDPLALIPPLRRKLTQMDNSILFVDASTVQDRVDRQTRPWRLGAVVFAMSGLLALLVAAVGIYSVMSYLIADRHHEIGVRIALGAKARDITTLVLRGSLVMAAIGVVVGELIALIAGRFVQPLLFDTSARDLTVYLSVGALLFAVALAATVVPALRAKQVNPLEALRAE